MAPTLLLVLALAAQGSQPALQQPQAGSAESQIGIRPTDSTSITTTTVVNVGTNKERDDSSEEQDDFSFLPGVDPNWFIAALTLALLWVAHRQHQTAVRADEHFRAVERAYLSLSHRPPGLGVPTESGRNSDDEAPGNFLDLTLEIAVSNLGNTPARLTRSCFQFVFTSETLPRVPVYNEGRAEPTDLLLIRGDNFTIRTRWRIPVEEWQQFLLSGRALYVTGYADYIDKFNGRHRVGWGRQYDHHGPSTNNLPYFSNPGYNYDRPRQPGEGNDWDESAAPLRQAGMWANLGRRVGRWLGVNS